MSRSFDPERPSGTDHPCEAMLVRHLDDELGANDALRVQLHVESCPSCRRKTDLVREALGAFADFYKGSFTDVVNKRVWEGRHRHGQHKGGSMRVIPILAVLLVPALVAAQAPAAPEPAQHKVEIDNPQVRVLRTTLSPGQKTIAHDHPAGVAVFLTDSTYRINSGTGAPRNESGKRGDVRLTRAGKDIVENLGTSPLEIVTIELKTPAVVPWKELALDAVKADPNNFKVISENEGVRVLHSTAKAPAVQHEHPPYVYVLISGGSGSPGGIQYRPAARHAPVNDGVNIMIELKTQNPVPAK